MKEESAKAILEYIKRLALASINQEERLAALESAVKQYPEVAKHYQKATPTSKLRGELQGELKKLYEAVLSDETLMGEDGSAGT
jgi:lipid II:glycine glycyltransferase (peptidoglycan interpeptide bridge formation enzyme)